MRGKAGNAESSLSTSLFFREKRHECGGDEEREIELGRIIKEAREAVFRENEYMAGAKFRAKAEEVLKIIRAPKFDVVSNADAQMECADQTEEEDLEDVDSKPAGNPYGLDDEETDILMFLSGERKAGPHDKVPDRETLEKFSIFRKKKALAEEAAHELARNNMGLIVSIARQYRGRGIQFMDLIQEGYQGALAAAYKFDPSFNCKFATYAAWWIKQSVRGAVVKKKREIRFPQHIAEKLFKLAWARNEIRHGSSSRPVDQKPTVREIAEKLEMSVSEVEKLMSLAYADKILDAPAKGMENEMEMHEIIADARADSPEDRADLKMKNRLIGILLEDLDERERDIVKRRYGLNGNCETETLETVGDGNLSRERIRQIEANALKKMARKLRRMTPVGAGNDLI